MLIKNNTSLEYSIIGIIIDNIMENTTVNTHYIGEVDWTTVRVRGRIIKIQIRYLKRYTEWTFEEKKKNEKEIF